MSKSIKVSEDVYHKLLKLQRSRETFSQQIESLLTIQDKVVELMNVIEGQAAYAEWKLKQFRATKPLADVIGTDLSGEPLIERVRHE